VIRRKTVRGRRVGLVWRSLVLQATLTPELLSVRTDESLRCRAVYRSRTTASPNQPGRSGGGSWIDTPTWLQLRRRSSTISGPTTLRHSWWRRIPERPDAS